MQGKNKKAQVVTSIVIASLMLVGLMSFVLTTPAGPGLSTITGYDIFASGLFPPVVDDVTLSSTGRNKTSDDLNVGFAITDQDVEDVSLKNVTDWRVGGASIAVLNLQLESDGDQNDTDYSTFGNGISVFNVLFNGTSGHDGFGAFDFNGTTGYINVTDSSDLTSDGGHFSVMLRAKTVADINSTTYLICKQDCSVGGAKNGYEMFLYNGTSFKVIIGNTTASSSIQVNTTGVNYQDGSYHHFAFTYDGTDLILYVDGTKQANGSYAHGSNLGPSNVLIIGANATNDLNFNGTIDEVFIFNRSLSSEQITAISNKQNTLIVSQETEVSESWTVAVTPFDGTINGTTVVSNAVVIASNFKAIVNNIILNTTFLNNLTTENLTFYFNATDVDGDSIKNITDFRENGTSIAVLNLPFEAHNESETNATDYSTFKNNGTVIGATFTSTGGHDGFGAYVFDGSNDYIVVESGSLIGRQENGTIMFWVKSPEGISPGIPNTQTIYDESDGSDIPKFGVRRLSDDKVLFDTDNTDFLVSTIALSWNSFNHIAVTWTNPFRRLYPEHDGSIFLSSY